MRIPDPRELLSVPHRVFRRFPLTASFALALGGLLIWWVHHHADKDPQEILPRLAMALGWGISLSFLAELQRRERNPVVAWGLPAAAVATLALWTSLVHTPLGLREVSLYLLLVAATHLAVSLSRGGDHDEFWHWNRLLLQRFVETWLFAGVLSSGLTGALFTLEKLLSVTVSFEVHSDVSILVATAFTILHFLSGIPTRNEPLTREVPPSMRVFATRVLLPLAAIYLVLLYVYMAKIIFTWKLPEGLVSAPILAFAAFGILAQLLLHPFAQGSDSRWTRLWVRCFHALLIPLCGLLGVAIGRRVSDYGLTEERYFILVLTIWLAVQALWYLSGRRSLRFVPISLLAMSLLGGWGPWGAFETSRRSQLRQLGRILDSLDVVVGQEPGTRPDSKTARRVTDLVKYLCIMHDGRGLEKWVPGLDTVGGSTDRASMKEAAFHAALHIQREDTYGTVTTDDMPVVLTFNSRSAHFAPRTSIDPWNMDVSPATPTSEILPVSFQGRTYRISLRGLDTVAAHHPTWSSIDSQLVLHDTAGAADILVSMLRIKRDPDSPTGWSVTELSGSLLR